MGRREGGSVLKSRVARWGDIGAHERPPAHAPSRNPSINQALRTCLMAKRSDT